MNEVKRMLNEMQTLGSHAAAEVDVIDEPGLDWLLKVEKGKEVVICGLGEGVFAQTLIGYKKGKDWNTEKLLNWNFGACAEWRIRDGSEQGWRHPMEGCCTEELEDADKLVYMRNIEGMLDSDVYFEIDQRMSQALGLHWRKEMHGWGRVNSQGDWETIVTWCMDKEPNDGRDCHLITMKRAAVDAVANSLGGQVITVFDVIRMKTRPSPDIGDENTTKEKISQTGTRTIYRSSKGATATYIRGV